MAKWDRSKDKMPNVLKNDPAKHPFDVEKEAKKGGKIKRNKIGQVEGR